MEGGQRALTQLTPPPLVGARWKVWLCVQNLLAVCNLPIKKRNLIDDVEMWVSKVYVTMLEEVNKRSMNFILYYTN